MLFRSTTLPYETNMLDLDPVVKDPLGVPVIRITGEFKENERKADLAAARHIIVQLKKQLRDEQFRRRAAEIRLDDLRHAALLGLNQRRPNP